MLCKVRREIIMILDMLDIWGEMFEGLLDTIGSCIAVVIIFVVFLAAPTFLLINNWIAFCRAICHEKQGKYQVLWEWISVGLSIVCSFVAMSVFTNITGEDWNQVLVNEQMHIPIWRGSFPTMFVLIFIAMCGYLILSTIKISRLSPIVIVSSIAAMYIGVILCVVWMLQVLFVRGAGATWLLCIAPGNCIMIAWKTILVKMHEWKEEQKEREYSGKWIAKLNQWLTNADRWPVVALIFMVPLVGIVIAILTLFGQEPDTVIKAWTETSDWGLSQKIAPQNIHVDEHYLCTVAAGGHRSVVKPIRRGVRHGHEVIVNRQLCVANAFEEILSERTPRLHKRIRGAYDKYGFPVARLIRSRYIADLIYILMKPLEWFFLLVIYTCDVKPENRIAVQYMPKR